MSRAASARCTTGTAPCRATTRWWPATAAPGAAPRTSASRSWPNCRRRWSPPPTASSSPTWWAASAPSTAASRRPGASLKTCSSRARTTAVHDWMRRSVADPEAYQRRLQAIQEATLLSATRAADAAFGPGAGTRDAAAVVPRPGHGPGVFVPRPERAAGGAAPHRGAVADRRADRPAQPAPAGRARGPGQPALAPARAAASRCCCIDLDRFRQINDSLGHETGDRVLVDVAQRIKSCMRADDLLARTGGDQFALIVEGADTAVAEATARRVLEAVAAPYNLDGCAVHADLQHRRRAVPGQRPQRRRTGASCRGRGAGGQGRRPRQLPRAEGAAAAATAAPTSSSTMRCARRWPAGASACTTSRRSNCAAAASSAPRR